MVLGEVQKLQGVGLEVRARLFGSMLLTKTQHAAYVGRPLPSSVSSHALQLPSVFLHNMLQPHVLSAISSQHVLDLLPVMTLGFR